MHSASAVALMVFRQVELDSLAWFQLGQAAVLHRSEVDEDVLASVDGNESCPCSRLNDFTVPTTIMLPA